jgi:hypothetical protein
VTTYEPAKNRSLAAEFNKGRKPTDYKLAHNALSRFLKDQFPKEEEPHRKYVVACRNGTIASLLRLWNREPIDRHADLLPHESGREDD